MTKTQIRQDWKNSTGQWIKECQIILNEGKFTKEELKQLNDAFLTAYDNETGKIVYWVA